MKISPNQVLDTVRQLPSLPDVVLRLMQTFQQDNPDIEALVADLGRDQALAVRVLRLANSPFYGVQKRVSSLGDAMVVLGFRNVRSAVASIAVTRCFARDMPGFDTHRFWEHGAAVGVAARHIAKRVRQSDEVAFTAGLVHDIGILALMTGFPDAMQGVFDYRTQHGCLQREAEIDCVGIDHAEAGAVLLERWQFPAAITNAVRWHHLPDDAGGIADVVHVADALVHALGLSDGEHDPVPHLSEVAFNRLQLSVDSLKDIMADVTADFEETFKALFH